MIAFCFLADINECLEAVLAGVQPCDDESMVCRDTPGSFTCLCPSGTQLTNGECREPGMHAVYTYELGCGFLVTLIQTGHGGWLLYI